MKQLLSLTQQLDLQNSIVRLGFRPYFIAETGSKAWGTDVASSDHDLTVVADDTIYDIYQYPRTSISVKADFNEEQIDVRVFSIEKFLRQTVKSNLVAYEAINTQWHMGEPLLRGILEETIEFFYDPREMFRSARGNLGNVRAGEMKGRRQQFRYAFICLQLIDGLYTGAKPMMNAGDYLNLQSNTRNANYNLIQKMFNWALCGSEDDDAASAKIDTILRGVRDYDFPSVFTMKQGDGRAYANAQFAAIKALVR